MTLTEMTALLNEHYNNRFGTDYAGHFDISMTEAERIASRSKTLDDFLDIWVDEDDWKDENHPMVFSK